MVVAPRDFRDEEVFEPKAAFEAAGAEVVVASEAAGRARGCLGGWVVVDAAMAEVRARELDAVVFAGGTGSRAFLQSRSAWRLCRDAVEERRVLAAICLAPGILARAGVLAGRRATAFADARPELEAGGAVWVEGPVCVDGKLITATGPQVAKEFARAILAGIR